MSNSSDDERPSKRRKICVVTDVDDAFSRRLEKVAEFLFTFPHSESETKNISFYLRNISFYLRINKGATRDEVVCAVKANPKRSIFMLLDCFTMTNLLALYQFLSGNGRWSYGKSSLCSSIRDYVYFGFFPLSRRIEERSVLDIQKIEPWNIFFELRGISVPCDVVMIIVSFMDGTLDNLELISRDWYMVSLISHQSCTIRSNNLFRAPLNVIKYTKSVLLNLNYMTDKEITYVWESLSPTRLRSLDLQLHNSSLCKKFWRIARDHEIMVGLRTLNLSIMTELGCGVEMRLATIFPNLSKVVYPPFIQWCIGLIHLETLELCGPHDLVILGEFASLKYLELYDVIISERAGPYLAKNILQRLESFVNGTYGINFFQRITEDLPLKKLDLQYTTTNSLSTLSKYTRLDSLTCSIENLRTMKSQLNVLTWLYVTGSIYSSNKHDMAMITEALVKSRYWRKLRFYIFGVCDVNIQILREAKVIEINFRRNNISFGNIESVVDWVLISHRETKPEWCCLKIKTRRQSSSPGMMRKTKDLMFGKGFRYVRTDRNDDREVIVKNFGGVVNIIGGFVIVFRLREK